MRNRIFGAIGVLWGGAILAFRFFGRHPETSGAYALGQTAAILLGGLLFVVGLYYLVKGSRS